MHDTCSAKQIQTFGFYISFDFETYADILFPEWTDMNFSPYLHIFESDARHFPTTFCWFCLEVLVPHVVGIGETSNTITVEVC